MSILSDLADEALKPVKTGIYIAAGVATIGTLAIAANSKPGRKFFSSAKKAFTDDPKTKKLEEKKKITKTKEEIEDDNAVNMIEDNHVEMENETQEDNIKGANNV